MVIQKLSNCLPLLTIGMMISHIKNGQWNYGWISNDKMGFAHWNQDLGKGDAANSLDISDNLQEPFITAWKHLQSEYFPNTDLLRCYANGHTYGVEGYPHTDSRRSHDKTLVIYLNEVWKREWGGETIIYDQNDIVHAELPKFNHGLVFPGNAWHVARGVSRICPTLRTTVMFKFCPKDIDKTRNIIQRFLQEAGVKNIPHRKGNLMNHLLRTYDILKSQNYSDVVCKAGGLHSIFGTNHFKHTTIQLEDRNKVEEVIGIESTDLVELFCKINRPTTLEDALKNNSTTIELINGKNISITQEQLNNLCAIEAANLHDQAGLDRYAGIKTFFKG